MKKNKKINIVIEILCVIMFIIVINCLGYQLFRASICHKHLKGLLLLNCYHMQHRMLALQAIQQQKYDLAQNIVSRSLHAELKRTINISKREAITSSNIRNLVYEVKKYKKSATNLNDIHKKGINRFINRFDNNK
jgi:hypothetical protein